MGRARDESSSSSSSSSEEESRRRRKRHRDDDDDSDDASTDDDSDSDSEEEKRRIKKKKQKKQKKKHHKKKKKRHRHRSEDTENVVEIKPEVKAYKIKSVCLEKQTTVPPLKKSMIHEDDKDVAKKKLVRDLYHNKAERYPEQYISKNKQDEDVYLNEERHTLKKIKKNYDYGTINEENNDNRYHYENKPSSSAKKEYSREYYGEHKESQRNYPERKEKDYIPQSKEVVHKKRVIAYEQHDRAIYDNENSYAKHIERRAQVPETHINEKRHLKYDNGDDNINYNRKRERNFEKKHDEEFKNNEQFDKRRHKDYQEFVDNRRSFDTNQSEQRAHQFNSEKRFKPMERREYPDDVEDHRYKYPSYKRDVVYEDYREDKQENITRKHNLNEQPSHSQHKHPSEYYQNNNNTGRQSDYKNQHRSFQERSNYRERPPKQDNRFADKFDNQQHSSRQREHLHYNTNRETRIRRSRETEINNRERNQSSTFERNTERKRKFSPQGHKYDEKKSYEWGKNDKSSAQDIKQEKAQKEKPNFGLSGKLTEDVNTVNGIVIKYSEPPEARKPKRRWRFYPFKGEQALPILYIHRQSCFLLGRDRLVVDIPLDHPSISKQHAVLQYRLVPFTRDDGSIGKRVRPYIIDLGSANGTFINNKKIDPSKYVELLEKDVVKFGFSQREYVLLHENSKEEDMDDDDDVKTIIKTEDVSDINKSIKSEADT